MVCTISVKSVPLAIFGTGDNASMISCMAFSCGSHLSMNDNDNGDDDNQDGDKNKDKDNNDDDDDDDDDGDDDDNKHLSLNEQNIQLL